LWLGDKGREVFSTWTINDDEEDKTEVYFENLKNHITPKVNAVFARYQFSQRNQNKGEKSEVFITALTLLIQHCDYDQYDDEDYPDVSCRNDMMCDRIIAGIESQEIRRKLLHKGDELKGAIEMIQTH